MYSSTILITIDDRLYQVFMSIFGSAHAFVVRSICTFVYGLYCARLFFYLFSSFSMDFVFYPVFVYAFISSSHMNKKNGILIEQKRANRTKRKTNDDSPICIKLFVLSLFYFDGEKIVFVCVRERLHSNSNSNFTKSTKCS